MYAKGYVIYVWLIYVKGYVMYVWLMHVKGYVCFHTAVGHTASSTDNDWVTR